MTDHHTISTIKSHSGKVTCIRCGTEMDILRGAILPSRTSRTIVLFAEFQCPECNSIVVFKKHVPGGQRNNG